MKLRLLINAILSNTYATNVPKRANGELPINLIFRWHESNKDVLACGGGVCVWCNPIMPPAPFVGPTMCAGERSILLLLLLLLLLFELLVVVVFIVDFLLLLWLPLLLLIRAAGTKLYLIKSILLISIYYFFLLLQYLYVHF